MATPSLLQRAKAKAPPFARPDIAPFIPKGQEDAVARLVAAGIKQMTSPQMRDEVMKAIEADQPVGQKIGSNAAGIVLMLMEQAQGQVPPEAIFPAGAELMSECAEMLIAAGQPVTQEDWKDGFFVLIGTLGKHFGGTDEQIMGEIGKHAPGGKNPDGEGPDDMAQEPQGEPMPQEDMA